MSNLLSMFAKLLSTKITKKVASGLAGVFLVFMNLAVPINAAVYPGNPGTGVTPGAYNSYDYNFCYYNNNDDLECFDSTNAQIGIAKEITNSSKLRLVSPADNGTTVPYRITLTNNTNPAQTLNTFYLKDYLPDAVASIGTPAVTGGTASTTGNLALSDSNTSMVWTGVMAPAQTVIIEFNATVNANLSTFIDQYQTNTACVSSQPITDGNNSVLCNNVTFEVAPTPVGQVVDLMLNKNINGSNAFKEGDSITYSFTVTNVGGVNVSTFNINENSTVDSRSVWPSDYLNNITSVTASTGSASVTNNVITVSGITLTPGQSVTVNATTTIKENIASRGQNTVATNRACVQAENDVNSANDCGSFNTIIQSPLIDNPQLGIEKQISDNSRRSILVSEASTAIPYRVTITNTTSPARNISEFFVTDVLPPALNANITNIQVVSGGGTATQIGTTPDMRWSGNLAFNSQVVITFNATLVSNLASLVNTTQRNTACVQLTQNGRDEGCHYDDFVISPETTPTELDLELFKGELNGDTGFKEGDTITYEFIVTNNSSATTDTFVINESAWPTQYINNLTASGITSSSGTVTLDGNNITWTTGQTNPLAVYGGTVTITATATVKTGLNLTNTTPAPNRACVEATSDASTGPRGGNNCHEFSVNITPIPTTQTGISIQKITLDNTSIIRGTDTTVSYEITAGNATTDNITSFTIVEEQWPTVFSGITGISVSRGTVTPAANGKDINWTGSTNDFTPGTNLEILFTGTLKTALTASDDGQHKNIASITYKGVTKQDDAEFTINAPGGNPETDLGIQKEVASEDIIVIPGETVNYTFTVTNNSAEEFDGSFRLDEQWPSEYLNDINTLNAEFGTATKDGNNISWTGKIASGAKLKIIVTAVAKDKLGEATNVITIKNPDGTVWLDDVAENDSDKTTVTIVATPGKDPIDSVEKILNGNLQSVAPNASVTFTARFTNTNEQTVSKVTIKELETNFVINTITANIGTITGTSPTYTWSGTLPSGQSLVVTINGTVADAVGQNMQNRITFEDARNSQNTPIVDPNPGNNTAITPPVPIQSDPSDSVTKVVDGNPTSVLTGAKINFTSTVTNRSGKTVSKYTITEQPSNFRIDTITASTGTITGTGPYTWAGTLANGQTLTVRISGTATGASGTNIVNVITFADARDPSNNPIVDSDTRDNTAQTPPVPIRGIIATTPTTGGAAAITAGVLGAASLAGAGYYFLRKRGGYKLSNK